MSCHACASFASNPLSGAYKAGCVECATRAIANSPAFFESQRLRMFTPSYKLALEQAFAGDWRAGHEAAKAWAEKHEKQKETK